MHAAAREPDAVDGVHVGDDRVYGERATRVQTRVQRLEGEDPAQPLVGQEPADRRAETAESAQHRQPRQLRGQQAQRRVEVRVDEAVHLGPVHLGQPAPQPPVSGRFLRPGEPPHLLFHRGGVGVHVEYRAVGESRLVGRVQRDEVQALGQRFADRAQRFVDQLGHGQHGRTGVDPVSAEHVQPGPPAGHSRALDHRHPSPGARQVQGCGQPGQARADDHDVVGATGDRAHQ